MGASSSGRADSNRRPPAPKLEPAQIVYQQKHSFLLLRANIRSHTSTVWFGRVPLVLLPRCYLSEVDERFRVREGGRTL